MAEFKEKFIAFIDILGFKSMVEASENGIGMPLEELIETIRKLGKASDADFYRSAGPRVCSNTAHTSKDLDFQITQVSDCAVISSEVSPAGLINLIYSCWSAALSLMASGHLIRGYVTMGNIYHQGSTFLGTGYQKAYHQEAKVSVFKIDTDDERTPFVEIDNEVVQYLNQHGDDCVKKMFSRFALTEDGVTGIYPFQALHHSYLISGFGKPLDMERERTSNELLRNSIQHLKAKVLENVEGAGDGPKRKAEHYIRGLDRQLDVCDWTDRQIDAYSQPGVPVYYDLSK